VNENKMNRFWQILLWFAVLLFSVLLLVAISGKTSFIFLDYQKLKAAHLSFGEIIGLRFPTTTNLIGPFGAFFAYWFSYFLGKYVCLALFAGTALVGFFRIFRIAAKNLELKVVAFWLIVFFGQQFVMVLQNIVPEEVPTLLSIGIFSVKIFELFTGIFGDIGFQIIVVAITLTAILIILKWKT